MSVLVVVVGWRRGGQLDGGCFVVVAVICDGVLVVLGVWLAGSVMCCWALIACFGVAMRWT